MTSHPLTLHPSSVSTRAARFKMPSATVTVLLLITLIGILGGLTIDLFFYVGPWRYYGQPYWGGAYPLKTFLAVLSTICFAIAMIRFKPTTENQSFQERVTPHTQSQGLSAISSSGMIDHSDTVTPGKELVIWGVLFLSGSLSTVFLYSPRIFERLAKEDGIIESLSAVMWFLAFGVFIYMLLVLRQAKVKPKLLYLLPTAGLAFVCFLIGMEEVSWFQRILSIKTPEGFSGNSQGELNFHNFYPGLFDHAYYFSAFLFLILLPFVQEKTNFLNGFRYLEFFVPGRFIVMVSAILVAYSYYGWNFQLIQVSFFFTLFILAYYAWGLRSQGRTFLLPAILLGGLVATQALFLINDRHLIIFWEDYFWWDLAEYKEFFIPLSFLVYSLEVLKKAKGLPH